MFQNLFLWKFLRKFLWVFVVSFYSSGSLTGISVRVFLRESRSGVPPGISGRALPGNTRGVPSVIRSRSIPHASTNVHPEVSLRILPKVSQEILLEINKTYFRKYIPNKLKEFFRMFTVNSFRSFLWNYFKSYSGSFAEFPLERKQKEWISEVPPGIVPEVPLDFPWKFLKKIFPKIFWTFPRKILGDFFPEFIHFQKIHSKFPAGILLEVFRWVLSQNFSKFPPGAFAQDPLEILLDIPRRILPQVLWRFFPRISPEYLPEVSKKMMEFRKLFLSLSSNVSLFRSFLGFYFSEDSSGFFAEVFREIFPKIPLRIPEDNPLEIVRKVVFSRTLLIHQD